MITLEFGGRVKNRKRYEEFAINVINDLLPRSFKRDISVFVHFTKNINEMGLCHVEEKDVIGVQINTNQSAAEIAQTLAHELVHVKQFIRKELNADMDRWKRDRIPEDVMIPYRNQPWEIEAFEKEVWLTKAYW